MDPKLKQLCEDIKRLVPPSKAEDPTDQFSTFINGLTHVSPKDIDSICRAYNYFNGMIGISGLVKPEGDTPQIQTDYKGPVENALQSKSDSDKDKEAESKTDKEAETKTDKEAESK
jgi:hypothetical protein